MPINCSKTCTVSRAENGNISGSGHQGEIQVDVPNQRVIVKNYLEHQPDVLIREVEAVAADNRVGKIIFFAKQDLAAGLEASGYVREGDIPCFYNGINALCYARFLDSDRSYSYYLAEEDKIISGLSGVATVKGRLAAPGEFNLRRVEENDFVDLANLFRRCFVSYPSPLFDTNYLRQMLAEGVVFLAAFAGRSLVSAASAHVDGQNNNAEISDCATAPDYRGQGLLTALLDQLAEEMWQRRTGVLYSLARAGSVGMNMSLHKLGYGYRGRLINNCHIAGRFENMNLWVKLPLSCHRH